MGSRIQKSFYSEGDETVLDLKSKGKGWRGHSKERVLFISDTQFPYGHQDMLPFMEAVGERFKCGTIISVGDMIDNYWFSRYEKSVRAQSFTDDEAATIVDFTEWGNVFPEVRVIAGNHEDRFLQKLASAGIPSDWFPLEKMMKENLGMSPGWSLHKCIMYPDPCCGTLVIHGHEDGATAAAGNTARQLGWSVVKGHNHSFSFVHVTHLIGQTIRYDMQLGCLINDKAEAFKYNRTQLKRPILNAGICIGGHKYIIPMIVDKNGRWTGELI